jgi:hypothetical protein
MTPAKFYRSAGAFANSGVVIDHKRVGQLVHQKLAQSGYASVRARKNIGDQRVAAGCCRRCGQKMANTGAHDKFTDHCPRCGNWKTDRAAINYANRRARKGQTSGVGE